MKKAMILVIDGCKPDYLTEETAPNIFRQLFLRPCHKE